MILIRNFAFAAAGAVLGVVVAVGALPAWAYSPIERTQTDRTVILTGADLTVEEVVAVARHGARVELTEQARQRSEDAYELLLEGARQGMAIYWFNRAPGSGRERAIFEGDPMSPENEQFLLDRQLSRFERGPRSGIGPEVDDEEIVRAMLVVRANTMVYEAASPDLTQMLLDLLNHDVTPVVQSRGSPGEGDLPMMSNVAGTMVGAGDAYYRGERVSAAEALERAGLQPLVPFAADDAALTSTNAYSAGQAVLLLDEAERLMNWSDLTFATSMLGLNSSVTPLSVIPQEARPFPYQNWLAQRLLGLVRDSYLFELEGNASRIIQDPLSFRDYSQRNGAVWEAYDRLHTNILIQINSSDHNPAVVPGASPSDSWELDTPWLRQYYVEPTDTSPGGFIVSNANFVAQPWANDVQAFTMALSEAMAGSVQRVLRFPDTFFTVVSDSDILASDVRSQAPAQGASYTISDLMAEIQVLANPIPAQGMTLVRNVEDMESYTRQRVATARSAVDTALRLVAQEMLSASYWVEVRKAQDPARSFPEGPMAALEALRTVLPWQAAEQPMEPVGEIVYRFMRDTPASDFFDADAPLP